MFKVISSEIKKILSKPGIYVLAVLLAIILVLGKFIYQPEVYKTSKVDFGNQVDAIWSTFQGNGVNSGKKVESDNLITNALTQITSYSVVDEEGNKLTYKEQVNNLYQDVNAALLLYQQCQLGSNYPKAEEYRTNLIECLKKLRDTVSNDLVPRGSNNIFLILTSKANLDSFEENINDAIDFLNVDIDQFAIADRCSDYEKNQKPKIENALKSFIYPTLSKSIVKDFSVDEKGTRYYEVKTRLAKTYKDIEDLYNEASANATIKQTEKLNSLCNEYLSIANTYANLVNYQLISNAFSFVQTSKQMKILYLETKDEYNTNTNLIRYKYMFDKGLTENDFAHPLTIGTTSNAETNAYDYAYFVLRLFSFVIIAYAIMSACHAVSGEIKEGSMRYLAIRPVSRSTLLFGKLFAIFIMSTIMAIFSAIIAFCVGAAFYGVNSLTILTIFNGTTPITMHPILMLLLFLLSMLIELIVYVSIAMLLSCLLKSDLFAVTIMLVLYLINILLPAFVNNPNSWLAFYPFSHISLYSLFGSSVYATNTNFLNMILSAKVFTNTTLWLTLTVVLVIIAVVNIISTQIFKKKEL